MIESAEAIIDLVGSRSTSDLSTDSTRRAAALWHFTVLGEAANQLSETFKTSHPEIPWTDATRLRNRIVHGYWDISVQIIHAATLDDLPPMIESLASVLVALGDERSAHSPQGIEGQP